MKRYCKGSLAMVLLFGISIALSGCNAGDILPILTQILKGVADGLQTMGKGGAATPTPTAPTATGAGTGTKPTGNTPTKPATGVCEIIIYTQPGCQFCEQAKAYFTKKGMTFTAKDISVDPAAKTEMEGKLRAQGIAPGGVPVIDVCGTCLKGFDAGVLDQMVANATAGKKPTKPAAGLVGPLGN